MFFNPRRLKKIVKPVFRYWKDGVDFKIQIKGLSDKMDPECEFQIIDHNLNSEKCLGVVCFFSFIMG